MIGQITYVNCLNEKSISLEKPVDQKLDEEYRPRKRKKLSGTNPDSGVLIDPEALRMKLEAQLRQ